MFNLGLPACAINEAVSVPDILLPTPLYVLAVVAALVAHALPSQVKVVLLKGFGDPGPGLPQAATHAVCVPDLPPQFLDAVGRAVSAEKAVPL